MESQEAQPNLLNMLPRSGSQLRISIAGPKPTVASSGRICEVLIARHVVCLCSTSIVNRIPILRVPDVYQPPS